MSGLSYPMVTCPRHEGPQQSYIVCKHVLAGEPAHHHAESTDKVMGELLCAECANAAAAVRGGDYTPKQGGDMLERVKLLCRSCAQAFMGSVKHVQ